MAPKGVLTVSGSLQSPLKFIMSAPALGEVYSVRPTVKKDVLLDILLILDLILKL